MEYSQECEIYSWIVSLTLKEKKEKKKNQLGIVSVPPSVPCEACDAGWFPPSSSGFSVVEVVEKVVEVASVGFISHRKL